MTKEQILDHFKDINHAYNECTRYDDLKRMLDELGSGTIVLDKIRSEWIPISDRLPNLNDFNGPCVWQKKVLITGYLSFDDTKDLFVSEAYASNVVYDCVPDIVVVAWMPLPAPYKTENDAKLLEKAMTLQTQAIVESYVKGGQV